MAKFWTYSEVRTKVEKDTDTQDETFIDFDEMVSYCNEGIDEAEAEIHKINEDYFLQKAYLNIISGTDSYALPADIYGQKIRAVIYDNGSGTDIYEIERVQEFKKFLDIHVSRAFSADTTLRYYIEYPTVTDGFKITFVPVPQFTSSTRIRIWYLRNSTRVPLSSEGSETASNASIIDLPEFVSFVIAFMKERVFAKEERGSPSHQDAKIELEKQRQMMTSTLTDRFADNQNEIWKDLSPYYEHS